MDEIEKRKNILKAIIILTVCVIVPITCLLFAILVIAGIEGNLDEEIISTITTSIIGALIILLTLGIISYIIYRVTVSVGRAKNIILDNEKEYLRDIPEDITPAIASALYDLTTEVYRDYTATIIDLCIKGYLKLETSNDNYELKALDKEIMNLKLDEEYVYSCIKNNEKFDEIIFREKIFKQMEELGFIQPINKQSDIQSEYNILLEMVGVVQSEPYRRTEEGLKMTKKCIALKNFISKFTLIKEKGIDHYKTLEQYIPYALALGEADFIEDMIKNDERYRMLIYRK